jgi:hypothetical protein
VARRHRLPPQGDARAVDRSYGIQVARLAGLPPPVVARAREILNGLERDELSRGGRPSLSGEGLGNRQLGLFQAPEAPAESPVVQRLRQVDVEPPHADAGAGPARRSQARGGRVTRAARFVAALAVAAGVSACSDGRPADDGIVVGIANSPVNLDPRIGADEYSQKAHQLLFDPLLRIERDLSVVPALAESIDQTDAVTYVARLRRGVRFHDGRELTAEDVLYTFRSFLDPAFGGRSGAYRLLAAVDALDAYTVRFTLKEPFASFPINLVMGIVQNGSGIGERSSAGRYRPVPAGQVPAR